IVAALWAALMGVFLAARFRRQVSDRAENAADMKAIYELELEREIAARREYELELEAEAKRKAYDEQALLPIRRMIGLDGLTRDPNSGAAPIPVAVLDFLATIGIQVMELWGLSETTGAITENVPGAFRRGSVGPALPGVEVKLGEDDELLIRAPHVFLGYLQEDGTIKPDVDADGWFATGDIGRIDDDGFVYITDRKKELIITSGGKNIAPTKVEGLLRAHPLIGQAVAIGDRRPYVTALIVLDDESAPLWARAKGIEATDLTEIAQHPTVLAELEQTVAAANKVLAQVEQIKKYEVLTQAWTPETGEITPTMKLRRRVITERYSTEIEGLYG
ncbi:DUF6779 domain-containing protein, partial [Kibdelosporangium lantanae]